MRPMNGNASFRLPFARDTSPRGGFGFLLRWRWDGYQIICRKLNIDRSRLSRNADAIDVCSFRSRGDSKIDDSPAPLGIAYFDPITFPEEGKSCCCHLWQCRSVGAGFRFRRRRNSYQLVLGEFDVSWWFLRDADAIHERTANT